MSREAAGAAMRALRESRDWSLAELAAASGVSVMGLSYLERGARKPHKGTVQKVENALGLPPGSYSRLLLADEPEAELNQLLASSAAVNAPGAPPAAVSRHADTEVLEAHAQAHLDSLNTLIERLPPETSNEYETYILSVVTQCVKAELLAATSWRVAADAGGTSGEPLMTYLKSLESMRTDLLARVPGGIGSLFDRACADSGLPDAVIAAAVGIGSDELWDIRNRGVVPPAVLPRVRAFIEAQS